MVLKVGASSDVQNVGSAIAHFLDEGKQVQLRTMGASAVNQAVKATIIACQFTAQRGYGLALRPGFANGEGRDGEKVSVVTLAVLKV